jgi:hypothetical protein
MHTIKDYIISIISKHLPGRTEKNEEEELQSG